MFNINTPNINNKSLHRFNLDKYAFSSFPSMPSLPPLPSFNSLPVVGAKPKSLVPNPLAKKDKNEYEDEDIRLWREYKQKGNQQAKWELLRRMQGLISQYALTNSNVLPRPVVEAKLKRYTLEAIDKFDPSRKVKLSTFVRNHFQQLTRENIENMQAVRLPENVALGYRRYMSGKEELAERLGRDPNTVELAEHLGWGVDETARAAKRYHKEYIESKQVYDPAVSDVDLSNSVLKHVYFEANDNERYLMEHGMGYMGTDLKKKELIRRDLKLNPYQFYKLQEGLGKKLESALNTLAKED